MVVPREHDALAGGQDPLPTVRRERGDLQLRLIDRKNPAFHQIGQRTFRQTGNVPLGIPVPPASGGVGSGDHSPGGGLPRPVPRRHTGGVPKQTPREGMKETRG